MKSLKKKRRVQVMALAAVSLVAATGLIGFAMKDGINYFRAPSQIAANPPPPTETFRIGGLVEKGSLTRGQGKAVTFSVTDGGASVKVSYTGILPDLFEENQGMVGTGKLKDGVFIASEILAKHDETYMPREVVDALKEHGVYQDPNGS